MKTYKYKTLIFKSGVYCIKLIFQWIRGGDAEVTLIIVKGYTKRGSGLFGIGSTRRKAALSLQQHLLSSHNFTLLDIIPWNQVINKLPLKEKP